MPQKRLSSRLSVASAAQLHEELVDVVDVHNRPLAVLPLANVHQQTLLHRSVFVLVYSTTQRLFLKKRKPNKAFHSSRYDLSATGHVRAGEAIVEAASRQLFEELGMVVEQLILRASIPASAATGYEFVTLFSAGLAHTLTLNSSETEEGLYVDRQELTYLVANFRELLSTTLLSAWEHGLLF